MSNPTKIWDGDQVRNWLTQRVAAAKLDQATADRRGYEARDEYDKAAAEEWVCSTLQAVDEINAQPSFSKRIKDFIGQDEYPVTGIYDDVRFERLVRGYLRKLAKMTKANDGFDNTMRFQ